MRGFKVTIEEGERRYETLRDILPGPHEKLTVLFIAKTPALSSVAAGHYFQGRQGQMFWKKLTDHEILKVAPGTFEDENLEVNKFGLTDIVKKPRSFGSEPSRAEYQEGAQRILDLIKQHEPKVIVFVYKKVLDNLLKWNFGVKEKSVYGFNNKLTQKFNSKVFVFPMPATPCTSELATIAMSELQRALPYMGNGVLRVKEKKDSPR